MKRLIKIITSKVLLITVLLSTSSMAVMPPGSFYITGEIAVDQGDTEVYTMNPTYNVNFTYWFVSGGSITSQNTTTVTVNWTGTSGSVSGDVEDAFFNYYSVSALNVTITATGPSTPPAPTLQSSSCGQVILARATPPTGVTYYWQSSSSGTSTSSSSSTTTRTSGTIYYLRARSSSGTWSTSSSSKSYTIPAGTTWYADTDGDGFGDPSASLTQCSQPAGYVSDSTDACPTEYGTNNGCPNSGGTTTYTSDFEVGFGDWTQESNEDFDWTRKTGSTGSGGTGPTAANQGSYYIYTEASSPNYPSKTAIITSTSYALGSNGSFSFDYHMYGATMGQLTLSASSNGGSSWQTIWTLQGDQGNLWKTAQVDLSSYSGSTVKFRFTGVTGSSYTGDMGIDHIEITSQEGSSLSLSDQNYIYTIIPRDSTANIDELDGNQKIESVTYFDGLGRPIQNIGIRAGGSQEDIITHLNYDEFGRQDKEYLPISEAQNGGMYKPINVLSDIQSYYYAKFPTEWATVNDVNAYSQKEFEASPLNRLLKQAAPGEDWKLGNGNEIEYHEDSNTSNEVRMYKTTTSFNNSAIIFNSTLIDGGYYSANVLLKTVTKNENHTSGNEHTVEEFKDKLGRVILKRNYGDSDVNMDGDLNDSGEVNGVHDTYYVYDDYGNLSFVLTPKSEPTEGIPSSTELAELCYQYKYDDRNRLVEKKVPGKDWEFIIYNLTDQPVLVQDGNQRAKTTGEWIFTKYDAFGRVAYSGRKSLTKTRADYQNNYASVDGMYVQYEQRSGAQSLGGTSVYYSNYAIPTGVDEIYAVNYYDDYSVGVDPSINPVSVYGVSVSANVNGLPTVSKVKVLETSYWITTVTYYDDKGRAIYVHSTNPYMGTVDIDEYNLDFVGNVIESTTSHSKSGSTIVTYDYFTYDHMNRLVSHIQKIDNQDEELIVLNEYNDLGQLKSKKVGGDVDTTIENSSGLQTIDYHYNIRGWLKEINDIDNLGNDLFAFRINYNSSELGRTSGNFTELYNGNISETIWRTANDVSTNKTRGYAYDYDALNRIIYADLGVKTTGAYNLNSAYDLILNSYDKNGNIVDLERVSQSAGDRMDDLRYTYDSGNKLLSVKENSTDATYKNTGFKDGNPSGNDYEYDINGNMTKDLNKGISSVVYNYLNLPVEINFGATDKIEYVYDATGVKIQKTVSEGSIVTDYAGIYEYENGNLVRVASPEGYIEVDGTSFDYVYQFKDHLGNVRLSYEDSNGNGIIASTEIRSEHNYYPFGLKHIGYNDSPSGVQDKYMFGGKEFDESFDELNTYDFGARNYDPALGRWFVVDALADEVPEMTPYRYGFNSPISVVDPDGNMEEDLGSTGYSWEGNGKFGYYELKGGASLNADGSITGVVPGFSGGPGKKAAYYQSYFSSNLAAVNGILNDASVQDNVPQAVDFSGFWGGLAYYSNGGYVNGHKYSRAGIYTGESLNMGVPEVGKFSGIFTKFAGRGVTTADGFLFKGFTAKAPFNIPVQRFGNMSLGRPDFWGPRIGTSKFANRVFGAIKPNWNPLTQYTKGVIPKGTPIKFGVIGPQGWKYPGGSLQFITPSKGVINQYSKIIPR